MKIKGMNELIHNLNRLEMNGEKLVQDIVTKTTIDVHSTAVEKVQAPGSGVIYVRKSGANLSTHQASAPGEAPATDTGVGVNSIRFKFDKLIGTVWTNLKYMAWLEFGTRKIAPRPWLWPSVRENEKGYKKRFDNLSEKMKKGFK